MQTFDFLKQYFCFKNDEKTFFLQKNWQFISELFCRNFNTMVIHSEKGQINIFFCRSDEII